MTTIALSDNERSVLETLRDASNTYPDGSFHPIAYPIGTLAVWASLPPSETRTVLQCLHERGLVQRRAPVLRDQLVVVLDEAAAEFTYQLEHQALELIGHGAPAANSEGPESGEAA